MIKDRCFICGAKIFNSTGRYNTHGNACNECSKRATNVAAKRMTEDEADEDVEARRKQVLKFNL